MKLIDKDALVVEIERLRDEALIRQKNLESIGQETVLNDMLANELNRILSFINTSEVKEVDLEKEISNYLYSHLGRPRMALELDWAQCDIECEADKLIAFAKHFFELGLKAQQNINIDITNIDKVIEENGVDPNSKEAKLFKESYYIALEKLKARKGK